MNRQVRQTREHIVGRMSTNAVILGVSQPFLLQTLPNAGNKSAFVVLGSLRCAGAKAEDSGHVILLGMALLEHQKKTTLAFAGAGSIYEKTRKGAAKNSRKPGRFSRLAVCAWW